MCWCTPSLRTPFCGKLGCVPMQPKPTYPTVTVWCTDEGDKPIEELTREELLQAINTLIRERDQARDLLHKNIEMTTAFAEARRQQARRLWGVGGLMALNEERQRMAQLMGLPENHTFRMETIDNLIALEKARGHEALMRHFYDMFNPPVRKRCCCCCCRCC